MANEPYVERTTVEHPAGERREEVRVIERRGSATGWWIAALVAVIAVAGLFFMYNQNSAGDVELQAARDGGRAEAMVENAATRAQSAAAEATEASAAAAANVADATRAAAERSAAAAEQTAQTAQNAAVSASDAASDAADTATDRPN